TTGRPLASRTTPQTCTGWGPGARAEVLFCATSSAGASAGRGACGFAVSRAPSPWGEGLAGAPFSLSISRDEISESDCARGLIDGEPAPGAPGAGAADGAGGAPSRRTRFSSPN